LNPRMNQNQLIRFIQYLLIFYAHNQNEYGNRNKPFVITVSFNVLKIIVHISFIARKKRC
jgi:hypothetical protein